MRKHYKQYFQNQQWTLLSLSIMVSCTFAMLSPANLVGSFWGIDTRIWFGIGLAVPILHQLYVWWVWRWELYSQSFTKLLGLKRAFKLYTIGFSFLFASRLISIIIVALATQNTLTLDPWISYSLTALFTPLVIFLFYSVHRYFGMERAYGIDHFDRNYHKPFEKKGIFKYTNNGMYTVGFLILYIPGLLAFSAPALLLALFNHGYIWVHFYTTEQPDMKEIFGTTPSQKS